MTADMLVAVVTSLLAAVAYGSYRLHLRLEKRRKVRAVRRLRLTFAWLLADGVAADRAAWERFLAEHREDLAGLHHDRP